MIPLPAETDQALRSALEAEPDGVLDEIARRHAAPLRSVFDRLPPGTAFVAPGARFEPIWREMTAWGPVVFIVHTEDGVFETKAALPPGEVGKDYFNIHGDSPLGGHIRADRCSAIYFIDRPFFKRRSCSIQFLNFAGGPMFKIFVARDDKRELLVHQLERFERLREAETGRPTDRRRKLSSADESSLADPPPACSAFGGGCARQRPPERRPRAGRTNGAIVSAGDYTQKLRQSRRLTSLSRQTGKFSVLPSPGVRPATTVRSTAPSNVWARSK
jgi:heme iron utilization protein